MSYSTATSTWLEGLNVKYVKTPKKSTFTLAERDVPGPGHVLGVGVHGGQLWSREPRSKDPASRRARCWVARPPLGYGDKRPGDMAVCTETAGRVWVAGVGGQASRSHPGSCQVGRGRGATEGGAVAGGRRAQQELGSQDLGALSSSDGGVEGLGRTEQGREQVRVKACACCIVEPALGTGRPGKLLQPRAGVDLAVAGSKDSEGDRPRRQLRGWTKQAGWGVRGGLCSSRTGIGEGVRAGNQLGALAPSDTPYHPLLGFMDVSSPLKVVMST